MAPPLPPGSPNAYLNLFCLKPDGLTSMALASSQAPTSISPHSALYVRRRGRGRPAVLEAK
jgi:hypothetical protein